MFSFINPTQTQTQIQTPLQQQTNFMGGYNFVQQPNTNNNFNFTGGQNIYQNQTNISNLNPQFNNMNFPLNNMGGFYNTNTNNNMNMNFNQNQQPQNNPAFQQPKQQNNNNQFTFNINLSNNNNNDDEFNEVEDEANKKPVVEKKTGLSSLLDSKLVNLDSLKSTGKSTNPNSVNYSGFNDNINKYNFY